MLDNASEFDQLLKRVRGGSQEAAWELVERYTPEILRVVRRRLPEQLRSKFDSQDFVQAAWASVFEEGAQLSRFERPQDFIAFIAAVASNKVKMEVRRRLRGQKHNIGREQSLNGSVARFHDRVHAVAPTPSQLAIAREQWFQLLKDQPSHYRQMVEMRYAGNSIREIADRLRMHEATVQRALRRMLRVGHA